mmetsp:Transcript_655/g.1483  ORF Transcript_655/g.1483 Transcript_655/m.1483 type:complete len:258 (-) Transcript_655:271-1044(-)
MDVRRHRPLHQPPLRTRRQARRRQRRRPPLGTDLQGDRDPPHRPPHPLPHRSVALCCGGAQVRADGRATRPLPHDGHHIAHEYPAVGAHPAVADGAEAVPADFVRAASADGQGARVHHHPGDLLGVLDGCEEVAVRHVLPARHRDDGPHPLPTPAKDLHRARASVPRLGGQDRGRRPRRNRRPLNLRCGAPPGPLQARASRSQPPGPQLQMTALRRGARRNVEQTGECMLHGMLCAPSVTSKGRCKGAEVLHGKRRF